MNRAITLGLLLATGVALGLRCPRLAERPMHNDEAVNTIKFRELWEQGTYKYDPLEYHGPSLPYATLALAKLTHGPAFEQFSEIRFRLVPLLTGLGLILLLPLVAGGLGQNATIWAALLTAVSPVMVFYSRYYIHELLLVLSTFLAFASGWRYWCTRKLGWALLAGTGVGLMHATKETFVITLAAGGLALGLNLAWNRFLDAASPPIKAPRLNLKHLAAAIGLWVTVVVVLFSAFFTNAAGPWDSVSTYAHWLDRAGGNSAHLYPWNFYLTRLLYFHMAKGPVWSEALIVVLALAGAAAAFARKGLGDAQASFVRFVALYTLILTAAYSLISYKTPWCLLNFWHGAILLAGVGAAVLVRAPRFQWARVGVAALLVAAAGQLAAQAWRTSTQYAADPRNPYVFAHTSPDVLKLVSKVESLAGVAPRGRDLLIKVMAPEGDYWPLPWYLRGFKQTGWWNELPADPYAPIMIVSSKFHAGLDEKKTHLMAGYFELRPRVFLELYVELGLWRAWLEHKGPGVSGDQ